MRLFSEDACPPVFRCSPREWKLSAEKIDQVITPCRKVDNPLFIDEDSGIGLDFDWVGFETFTGMQSFFNSSKTTGQVFQL